MLLLQETRWNSQVYCSPGWPHDPEAVYIQCDRSVEISAALAAKQKERVGVVKSHSNHFHVNCGSASDSCTWGTRLPIK